MLVKRLHVTARMHQKKVFTKTRRNIVHGPTVGAHILAAATFGSGIVMAIIVPTLGVSIGTEILVSLVLLQDARALGQKANAPVLDGGAPAKVCRKCTRLIIA